MAATSATAATADVRYEFNAPQGEMTKLVNVGTANTRQRPVSLNGGRVMIYSSYRGSTNAAGFPANDARRSGKRAAIAVTPAGSTDGIEPLGRNFAFGAHVRLGPITSSSKWDDGNNIMQRGLSNNEAQYKVQIEKGRASCRIKGSNGAAGLVSDVPILQRRWYAISCGRVAGAQGSTVTIRVAPISDNGKRGKTVSKSVVRRIGKVDFRPTVPLSIGAKLNDNETINQLSDQFNGRIDNVFLNIS